MSSGKGQIPTARPQHTPIRVAVIRETDDIRWCWRDGAPGTLPPCCRACKMGQAVFYKMKHPYSSAFVRMKTSARDETDIHAHEYTDPALSTVVQIWKQPRYPPVVERINRINKLRSIQIMDCYSALHRNELSSHEETWRKLKCVLLGKRGPSEKAAHCRIPTVCPSGKSTTMQRVKRSVVCRGWGGSQWTGGAQRIFFFQAVKLLCILLLWVDVVIHLSKPLECTMRSQLWSEL